MSLLATRSELDKLSETLRIDRDDLGFLEQMPAGELRSLRVGIYELLFRQDAVLLRRAGRIAARTPPRLAAELVSRRFGPVLAARVAAEMPARRALAVVARLSPGLRADIAAYLDPRRTRDLLLAMPVELLVEVAVELARRGEYMTMSRFVDALSDEAVSAVSAVVDEAVLLRIGFYMGSKNRLDRLFGRLPYERLERLAAAVADDPSALLLPFLSLLVHVSYPFKRRLGDLAAAQPEAAIDGYVRATHEQGLWTDVLPALAAMSERSRQRVVNLPVLREPAVQEGIIAAADAGMWPIVLPLVELMDDSNRDAVAKIVERRPEGTMRQAADAALMGEHWEALIGLVARMRRSKQDELAAIVGSFGAVDPDLMRRIAARAAAHSFGEAFERSGSGAS